VGLLGASGPDAFRRFQSTTTYFITCSDDSSEGDYDPTRECFVVIIGEGEGEVGGAGDAAVCDNVAVTPPVGVTPPPYDAACAVQIVVWTSLGPLPRWVPGPTTRWAPGTTRLALHDT
jgi:hypothetical protein